MKHIQNAIDLLEDVINEFDGKKQVYLSMDRICEIWEELKERVLHLERVNSILRGRLEREGKSTIFKNGLSYRE